MQTVEIPRRRRKSAQHWTDEQVKAAASALGKLKPGEALAPTPDVWYPTAGKARVAARALALAIGESFDLPTPRTHVLPHADGEQFTPAISPGKVA